MYLETIHILSNQQTNVRSLDVADYMGFSKPSVSRAVGLLKNGGYITVDGNGYISLTAEGRYIAEKIYERHTVLTDLLMSIGVDETTALEDACKMEHVISDTSFEALKKYYRSHKSQNE